MNNELLADFTAATSELLQLLSLLSEEELNMVPFPGSWTAGQVGHHLLKSYGVTDVLKGNTVPTERKPDEKTDRVKKMFLDFTTKMQAPEFITPSSTHIEKERLINKLQQKIQFVEDYVRGNPDLTLTCVDFELPGIGTFTRMEWIAFVTVHTRRHVYQLKNIISRIRSGTTA